MIVTILNLTMTDSLIRGLLLLRFKITCLPRYTTIQNYQESKLSRELIKEAEQIISHVQASVYSCVAAH